MTKPKIVEAAELDWLLKVTRSPKISGQNAKRNCAMILVLFGTGLTPGEIGQLLISDYLSKEGEPLSGDKPAKGKRKPPTALVRAEISFNGYERRIFWSNKRVVAAVDEYLAERVERGLGAWSNTGYRGLDPASPLFLGRSSEGFTYRESERNGKVYRQYASISQLYSKLFKQAGVQGAVSMSARRTLAVKLHRQHIDIRVIAEILGNRSLTAVKQMCVGDTNRLSELVKDVI